ncbi:hypothetical protein DQ237_12305 [Blastococcus sp. TF02-8]|uniref:hypothetical protein n=1 Tax=Blastococcus sp. TF02-8 TaxID=2250574 RepID=UPI000DE93CEF|nr:hypothetical protein [Blastococcus sp. TF02-8]RBY95915.1 hypothetical protein DQ237_12305 [Blastococcus sp. TF02-8]
MSDLYIDGAMLTRVRSNLSNICELMTQPAREMMEVTGSAMGASALARRMDEFGDEWSYGIGKLGEFAGGAVEALDRIAQAFEAADTALAGALQQAAEQ